MAYVIDLVKDAKYVSLVFTGKVTRNDLETARDEVSIALTSNSMNRVLVDISQSIIEMSFLDHFQFTSEHQAYFPRGGRIALVISQDEMKGYQFIEDVSQNRGVNVKLFSEKSQACNWLL